MLYSSMQIAGMCVCVCVREREFYSRMQIAGICVCVFVCVCVRERVSEREREREIYLRMQIAGIGEACIHNTLFPYALYVLKQALLFFLYFENRLQREISQK